MKALRWYGKGDVRVEDIAEPEIVDDRDVILRITSTAICGSDLHLYNGLMPTMEKGDVLGHESMGVVVDRGSAVSKLNVGDRVVVPFTIS
jgi:threonine dehydrogenase-like Zn-dependent dehydrogenase